MDELNKSEAHEQELYVNWITAEERNKLLLAELHAWRWNTVIFSAAAGTLFFFVGTTL